MKINLLRNFALSLLAGAAVSAVIPAQAQAPQVGTGNPWPAPGGVKVISTPTGLQYYDMAVGKGPSPAAGSKVTVHYTGWLLSNKQKFDSSLDAGKPFEFTLGMGEVIKGWDEGVASMRVGGRRRLVVPPQLGYGPGGTPGGPIPGNATLVFDVQLLKYGQ